MGDKGTVRRRPRDSGPALTGGRRGSGKPGANEKRRDWMNAGYCHALDAGEYHAERLFVHNGYLTTKLSGG